MNKTHEKRQGRENKIFKTFSKNQTITSCHIEPPVQEMTMNEKLTMIGLTLDAANDFEPKTNE